VSLPTFDANAVQSRLPMADCIDLMAETQAAISRGDISLPLRTLLRLDQPDTGLLIMPGSLSAPPVFGVKLISLFPDNPANGLPVIQGQVLLFDGSNGTPLALVEAASLTAIRTAAASGAATRALANPDARTLALLGYGVQAESHLAAMCAVRPIEAVRVWGPDPDKARAFANRHVDDAAIIAVESAEAAVRGADLICAVSAAAEPIIQGDWLEPGSHLNLVGAHSPTAREADGRALARATIFTEITEFAEADIVGEIGDVLNDTLSGRTSPNEITLYKSLGNTAQDLAAAWYILQND
jgi:ornithine cyclodeaminase